MGGGASRSLGAALGASSGPRLHTWGGCPFVGFLPFFSCFIGITGLPTSAARPLSCLFSGKPCCSSDGGVLVVVPTVCWWVKDLRGAGLASAALAGGALPVESPTGEPAALLGRCLGEPHHTWGGPEASHWHGRRRAAASRAARGAFGAAGPAGGVAAALTGPGGFPGCFFFPPEFLACVSSQEHRRGLCRERSQSNCRGGLGVCAARLP